MMKKVLLACSQRHVCIVRTLKRRLTVGSSNRVYTFDNEKALCSQQLGYRVQQHSVNWSAQFSNSSTQPSSSSESTADNSNVFRPNAATTLSVTPPRAIFPWRHEAEPLPRLIKGTPENLEQGGAFGPGVPIVLPWYMPFVVESLAATRLSVPWYRILVGNQWKHELAQSCAWAFSQGVAAVLSNTYQVPFDDIKPQDGKDEIRFRHTTVNDANGSHDSIEQQKETNDNTKEEVKASFCPEVEYMLETKLRHLYQSAHECGKGQMQIRLECQPTSATLVSLVWIPFLTRKLVADKPAFRHAYNLRPELSRIAEQLGRPPSGMEAMRMGMEIGERLADETVVFRTEPQEQHVWYGTVVAQVSVSCREVFGVVDLKTGEVVQGHGDDKVRPVTHLVRLENEVKTAFPIDGSSPTHSIGSWQITDWDDLLNGNLWLSL